LNRVRGTRARVERSGRSALLPGFRRCCPPLSAASRAPRTGEQRL